MAESAGERTEQATPKRREEARRRGTVVKSQDLVGAAGALALLMVLPVAGSSIGREAVNVVHHSLTNLPTAPTTHTLALSARQSFTAMSGGLGLLLATAMGVGFLTNVGQIGFKFSPEALTPSFEKINPMSGVKRLLSKQGVVETLKGIVKTVFFGLLAIGVLRDHWMELMTIGRIPPAAAFSMVADVLRAIATRVIPVWFVLSAVDYFMQYKRVNDQLKMTKEEVKREAKDAQTSPEVQKQRAKRARQISQGSMLKAVKDADVVITNPTHYAVAIKYEHGRFMAPVVLAKGVDHLAAKIREEAKANRVPIVPNPPLARALYKQCEVGDPIPSELFKGVAEVLAYVYRTLRRIQA